MQCKEEWSTTAFINFQQKHSTRIKEQKRKSNENHPIQKVELDTIAIAARRIIYLCNKVSVDAFSNNHIVEISNEKVYELDNFRLEKLSRAGNGGNKKRKKSSFFSLKNKKFQFLSKELAAQSLLALGNQIRTQQKNSYQNFSSLGEKQKRKNCIQSRSKFSI